jgi:dUTP pyrophosphatase
MKLKVKKLVPEAVLPSKASSLDVGYDCVAIDGGIVSPDGRFVEYRTGLAIQVPVGYHVELFPRSSISKYDLLLCNGVGLVDNGYRGELRFRFKFVPPMATHFSAILAVTESGKDGYDRKQYEKGDKIGQIVIRKSNTEFEVEEVHDLTQTDRGEGGFGSTGR